SLCVFAGALLGGAQLRFELAHLGRIGVAPRLRGSQRRARGEARRGETSLAPQIAFRIDQRRACRIDGRLRGGELIAPLAAREVARLRFGAHDAGLRLADRGGFALVLEREQWRADADLRTAL